MHHRSRNRSSMPQQQQGVGDPSEGNVRMNRSSLLWIKMTFFLSFLLTLSSHHDTTSFTIHKIQSKWLLNSYTEAIQIIIIIIILMASKDDWGLRSKSTYLQIFSSVWLLVPNVWLIPAHSEKGFIRLIHWNIKRQSTGKTRMISGCNLWRMNGAIISNLKHASKSFHSIVLQHKMTTNTLDAVGFYVSFAELPG